MLYREIMAVCSQIHTKHINTVCGQNVELLNVKLVVHIVTTGLLAKCYIRNALRKVPLTWYRLTLIVFLGYVNCRIRRHVLMSLSFGLCKL